MAGTRLKQRPAPRKGRLSRLNLLLLFLLAVLAGLLALLWLAAGRIQTQDGEEESTVTVGGQRVEIDRTLPQSSVQEEEFATETDGSVSYTGEALYGVDASSHQGAVNWGAVAGDGNDFAMLRIGYRGYTAGALQRDERFEENYAAAKEQGLQVGVYFFSQAITPEEAEEEARQVLDWLDGRTLECPVAYDWEPIEDQPDARTNGLDGETVTACAKAFCQSIQEGGYRPMLYCNGMLGYLSYDVSQLTEYPLWYAEYGNYPSFAYAFEMWQYTESGAVAGIEGKADRNIWFRSSTGE